MEKIKTIEELERIIEELDKQGFGRIDTYKVEQSKKEHIINAANVHNVHSYSHEEIMKKLNNTKSFEEMERIATEYFSKYSSKSKILEYVEKFGIIQTDECRRPSKGDYESNAGVSKWESFKQKWSIPDIGGYYEIVYIYDLTKSYIKVQFPKYSSWEFNELYKAVFKEEPLMFNEKQIGTVQNIGKIDLKFFANGNVDIKGSGLDALKKLYKEKLTSENYSNKVIYYGSDRIILEREPDRNR